MRLFPSLYRTSCRRHWRKKSLSHWMSTLRHFHLSLRPLQHPSPTHHLSRHARSLNRRLSTLCSWNSKLVLSNGCNQKSWLCDSRSRAASGIRLGHGSQWSVHLEIILEMGVLLFCDCQFSCVCRCLVGITGD